MMMERKERADCTVSALACVASVPYEWAHEIAKVNGRRGGAAFSAAVMIEAAKANGIKFHKLRFSRRRTLAKFLREYPTGRFYVRTRGHAFAVVDGVVADSTRHSRLVVEAWQFDGATE